ncbi:MAG: tRNA lysidine(34) synthetase TilS [Bacteroidales bacterium]
MLTEFTSFLARHGLESRAQRWLLAVSGGMDSVAMTRLFLEAGMDFGIAHCNFRLRGAESEEDARFVEELAGSLECPFHLKEFDVPERMNEKGISLQMAARELRYEWFLDLKDSLGYDLIATAHNHNDAVETFLLNLSRGSGVRGLTGIPVVSGNVVRPLLFASRSRIQSYVEGKGLSHRTDSSNSQSKYLRNKIRHEVIPILEQINPSFLDTMRENMKILEETGHVLNERVEKIRRNFSGRRKTMCASPSKN